jgi:hypothetical protein
MKKSLSLLCLALSVLVGGQLFAQNTSSWVFAGPDGKLQYRTDSQGNRIMDFSFAGYKGGGVALPTVAVAQTVSPITGDNTAQIQAAIDTVASLPSDANGFRGAVLLEPGTYDVGGTLNISASGVVVRGSGSAAGGTVLNMTGSTHLLFSVRGSGSWQTVGNSASISDAFVPSGAMSFHVNDATGFSVGDTVLIQRTVTAAWVHFMGMDTLVRNGVPETWIGVGSIIHTDRTITAINGTQVTLDAPLSDSFDSSLLTGAMVKYTFSGRISQVGVEDLSVVAPAVNLPITSPQYNVLNMNAILDGWIRNIQVQDTQNSFSIGNSSKQITLEGLSINHTIAHTGDGMADFSITGTEIFVDRCTSNGSGSWPIVTQGEVTGPIVSLNFNSDQPSGISPHQRWATGLLADDNQFPNSPEGTPGVSFSNRGTHGSGQGWDMGWGVAWNVTTPFFLVQDPPGSHNWCIGCVGVPSTKLPGPGPQGIIESQGTHVTPASLYLAQLKERLGNAGVANIGYGDFVLSATPASNSVTAGSAASYSISVTPSGAFTDSAAISLSGGLPAGATASFNPTSIASGSASMRVVTSASTPPGTYTLHISGTSGNLNHATSVTLTVNAAVVSASLEAEASGNTLSGAARVATCSACSGGKKVGFIGNGSNNFVTINNINVANSGSYKVAIFYLVNGTRSFSISVNGGPATTLSLSGTSFSVPAAAPAVITVQLKAGSNSIRFGNGAAFAPDLDRITIAMQ